jgi:hypothetical protein
MYFYATTILTRVTPLILIFRVENKREGQNTVGGGIYATSKILRTVATMTWLTVTEHLCHK